jgi:transposase
MKRPVAQQRHRPFSFRKEEPSAPRATKFKNRKQNGKLEALSQFA